MHQNIDMREWKQDMLNSYSAFLEKLDSNSEEYRIFKRKLKEFENIQI